jgi:protein-arginine kinase activator protein McsA
MLFRILIIFLFIFSVVTVSAQVSTSIAELEQQKVHAVEEGNFRLAAELKQKILALREKEEAEKAEVRRKAEEAQKGLHAGMQSGKEIEVLEQEKKEAVRNQDFVLANELLLKIKALKEKQAAANASSSFSNSKKNESGNAIEFLEKEKAEAVADGNYKLAGEINAKIKELKSNQSKNETPISNNSELAAKIKALENDKAKAVAEANYKLAGEINAKIKELNANPSQNAGINSALAAQIKTLEDEKAKAVAAADYKLAGEISNKIKNLKSNPSQYSATATTNSALTAQIAALENDKAKAIAAADYKLAGEISNKIKDLKNPPASGSSGFTVATSFQSTNNSVIPDNTGMKISKSSENERTGIKYRRSSLYTIMKNDAATQHASVIESAFVNSALPGKFNNHNLDTRVIRPTDQLTNEVAKKLVAAWFNRDNQGRFNMDLISQRGEYNASNFDIAIAKNSSRGMALLADAGEELIGNTFVIINEFKYTNKEEVANKSAKTLKAVGFLANFIPGAGSTIKAVTDVAAVGVTIAGKGFIVKNTSHLYRLVWNAQIANEFYNNYWIDENTYDENKKRAFENSNLFRLEYIGEESAWSDVQSSIFTNKSESDLIAKATIKSVDAGIAKLERKFEQFRTKTPLNSVDPLTAKIGKKEGLEAGDKFEVLEQVLDANGRIQYVRKGVIYVDGNNIWDNTYTIQELEELGKQPDQNQFTVFRGGSAGFAPGMLIRQIN